MVEKHSSDAHLCILELDSYSARSCILMGLCYAFGGILLSNIAGLNLLKIVQLLNLMILALCQRTLIGMNERFLLLINDYWSSSILQMCFVKLWRKSFRCQIVHLLWACWLFQKFMKICTAFQNQKGLQFRIVDHSHQKYWLNSIFPLLYEEARSYHLPRPTFHADLAL